MGSQQDPHSSQNLRLIIYPGEKDDRVPGSETPITMGTIYVVRSGRVIDRYDVAPGPRIKFKDRGHSAEPTPPGSYTLGHAERHTASSWPTSVIPWGAHLRETPEGVVEFQLGATWVAATGLHGKVTVAYAEFRRQSGRAISPGLANAEVRRYFFVDREQKNLRPTWTLNDFGKWSWNLQQSGKRSVFYIHTTPLDELADSLDTQVHLEQSHGCLHIQPADRDEMVTKGYLKAGMHVQIERYGLAGPPPETTGRR